LKSILFKYSSYKQQQQQKKNNIFKQKRKLKANEKINKVKKSPFQKLKAAIFVE
jgi:hypothetical protein